MRKKRAIVCRHAALGDTIQATTVIPYLLDDGYSVDFMVGKSGYPILENDPRINLIRFPDNALPISELDSFYSSQAADADKWICYTGIIEDRLLTAYPSEAWFWPINKRRDSVSNRNYFLEHVIAAGYAPRPEWQTGKLYFSQEDIAFSNNFRMKFKDRFIILVSISGSSLHKVWLGYTEVAKMILRAIPEALIVTIGSQDDMAVTFEHPRVLNFGYFNRPAMTSFSLCRIADLVVGPETGLISAAGCFDVPKICLLTHSSRENLTSTFKNDFSIQSKTWCSPCGKLQNVSKIWKWGCPLDKEYFHKHGAEIPACAGEGFPNQVVFDQIMKVYLYGKITTR